MTRTLSLHHFLWLKEEFAVSLSGLSLFAFCLFSFGQIILELWMVLDAYATFITQTTEIKVQ